ncbi:hypothetical protein [Sphingomonas sp. OTU376]|uniref:hypothetical protein n=1 Tax=Sphingomonas sp. OTU376 TaxID=3043863 RepID=UPI00313C7BD5
MTGHRPSYDLRTEHWGLPFLLQGTAVALLGLGSMTGGLAARGLALGALVAFLAGSIAARKARPSLFACLSR